MAPKLLGIALARNSDHQAEVTTGSCLHPRDGILDHHRPGRRDLQHRRGRQERIRGGLSREVPGLDHVAVDPGVEEGLQPGGLQDSVAVLTRGDDGNSEIRRGGAAG